MAQGPSWWKIRPIGKMMIQPINKDLMVDDKIQIHVNKIAFQVAKNTGGLQPNPTRTQPAGP